VSSPCRLFLLFYSCGEVMGRPSLLPVSTAPPPLALFSSAHILQALLSFLTDPPQGLSSRDDIVLHLHEPQP
jgi:hypothetical protein